MCGVGRMAHRNQDKLVSAVSAAAGAKTVVVVVTPGALLTPWAKDAAAILIPFMPVRLANHNLSFINWPQIECFDGM